MTTRSKEPRDIRRAIDIVILGAIGITQDEIANIVHCGKQTVVRYQKWFRELPYERARSLLPDDRIKGFIKEDFPRIAEPNDDEVAMVRERKPTTDSVLLYYGHAPAQEKEPEPHQSPLTVAQSINLDLLRRHWDRLREITVTLREQLEAPTAETLFTAKVCQRIHTSVIAKTPLIPPAHWSQLFEAPFRIRELSQGPIPLEVKLLVEWESLFPPLLKHFRAESWPLFSAGFPAWTVLCNRIVSLSVELMKKVTIECPPGNLSRLCLD